MIQRLPSETFTLEREEEDEGWRRAAILMASSTSAELIDPSLPAEQLLFRLFHEDGVRAHPAHFLAAQCRCSRERVESVLRSLQPDDLDEMKTDDGLVTVTCEFCSKLYAFNDDDLAALKAG
jgi:molecular chaperone Hsp33